MKTFVIYRLGLSGGTGTLSVRIAKWLAENGFEIIYIYHLLNDISNASSMKANGVKIHCWKPSEVIDELLALYGKNRSYMFLTYSLQEFSWIEKQRSRIPDSSSILYVVHRFGLLRGRGKSRVLGNLFREAFKNMIKKLDENENLIFMDEDSIETAENYYKIKIHNWKRKILRLPMYINRFCPEKINKKHDLGYFRILTICRAEFPFKGYVIGLVKDFERLCLKHENLRLTIISFGEKEQELREFVQSLEDKVKEKIELVGQTPYKKLEDFFDKSHVYIGMGTTLLDAANHGLPAINVKSYTYDNLSSGFLHQNPHMLSANLDETQTTTTYIERVIETNRQQYYELCKASHAVLETMYGIDTFMDRFLTIEPVQKKTVLSRWELFVCNLRRPRFLKRK